METIHVKRTKKYHTNAVLETNAEIQKSKDAIDKPDDRNQKHQCQYNLRNRTRTSDIRTPISKTGYD
uniref:Uncharacterized protein n=1 Tax=Romanomermis culicivorax TaxID=13658 RepID=A0A915K8M1_ROMCU